MSATIPLVDFSSYGLNISRNQPDKNALEKLGKEFVQALVTSGFAYVTNHGITDTEIQEGRNVAQKFFDLPETSKKKYSRRGDDNHGWVCLESERLNPKRTGDLKESFNVCPLTAEVWPNAEVQGFQDVSLQLFNRCTEVGHRILDVLGLGLGFEDQHFFRQYHFNQGSGNLTTLRHLYYPPIKGDQVVKPNQIRCGEHSDYGTITLLFQDSVGGLQVLDKSGKYIDAKPIPGSLLINIGDILERWTSDKLPSTKSQTRILKSEIGSLMTYLTIQNHFILKHRVMLPEKEELKRKARHSTAFFFHPDDNVIVRSLDGSDKYEPMTALDMVKMKFGDTY